MRNCPSHLYRAEIRFLFAFAFFNTIGRNSTTGRAPRIGHAGPIPLRRAPCRRPHDVLMCLFSLRILEYHFCPLGITHGRGTHCRRGDQQRRSDGGGARLIGKLKSNRGTTASSFRRRKEGDHTSWQRGSRSFSTACTGTSIGWPRRSRPERAKCRAVMSLCSRSRN